MMDTTPGNFRRKRKSPEEMLSQTKPDKILKQRLSGEMDLDKNIFDCSDQTVGVPGENATNDLLPAKSEDEVETALSALDSAASSSTPPTPTLLALSLGNHETDPQVATENAKLHVLVTDAKRSILSTAELSDMNTADEVSPDVVAIRAGYSDKVALAVLRKFNKHATGLNLFKIDPLSNPLMKGAPVARHKLDWLVRNVFSGAFDDIPYTITVGLTSGMQPSKAWGSLILVSPSELLWAPLIGLAKMLHSNMLSSEQIAQCRNAIVNAPVLIKWYENGQDPASPLLQSRAPV